MHLDSRSALLGALVGCLALASLGAQGITVTPLNPPVIISGIPTPQQMMQVIEGQPYVVPFGKIFVVTGIGSASISGSGVTVNALVDGASAAYARTPDQGVGDSSWSGMVSIPSGLSVGPGRTIEAIGGTTNPDDARVWGYLANSSL